jgi:hypothetical protein
MVIEALGRGFPMGCVIRDIKFLGGNSDTESVLELTIIPILNESKEIILQFGGVDGISLPKINYDGVTCPMFEVMEHTGTVWFEGTNWWVGDFKIDSICFLAKSARVVSVNNCA